MIAITADLLLTPVEQVHQPVVLVEDGLIAAIHSRAAFSIPAGARVVDFGKAILAPGYIDLHIHGAAGQDVMNTAADRACTMQSFLAQHGITSYCPTTVTAPMDVTLRALDRIADLIEKAECSQSGPRARPLGIHLEGPFLSHTRRGVHPEESLAQPSVAVFDRLWQAARGHVKLMTIAPELDGALALIAEAVRRGVAVSVGHSDATWEQTRDALAAGARHATHTFNAMRPLSHHDPGVLGIVLTDPSFTADIILDGIHVHPSVVKLFMRMKSADHAVLISDGLSATGMPEGHYQLGAMNIEVRDGKCLSGGTLAGSILTLDRGVRNAMKFGELDGPAAVRTATLNPAKVVGMTGRCGTLAAGVPADMVVLNSKYEVMQSIVHGQGV